MRTAIISLEYEEKSYYATLKCLNELGVDVFFAKRDGVGSMSRAYNDAYVKFVAGLDYDKVWFVSNFTFAPDIVQKLSDAIEPYGAIHPAFNSDHKHLMPDGSNEVKEIPFIEFTAPMFKTWVFEKYMLNEDYWYWFYDLIISKQMREDGIKMAVHHGAIIQHTYLRNTGIEEVTKARIILRKWREKKEIEQLKIKYGHDWHKKLFYYG